MADKTEKKIPPGYTPGPWHEGEKYAIRLHTDGRDTYPDDFVCWVEVTDREADTTTVHRGHGRFIGNFSPIWIRYKGEHLQVEQLQGRV